MMRTTVRLLPLFLSIVVVVALVYLSFATSNDEVEGSEAPAGCYSDEVRDEDGTPAPTDLTLSWTPYWESSGQLVSAITYLAWEDNSHDELCFIVEVAGYTGDSFHPAKVVPAEDVTTSLASIGCERYRVYAASETGRSAYSNEVSIGYNCAPVPGQIRADLNCDGNVSPTDALLVLRYDVGTPITVADSCISLDSVIARFPSPSGWETFLRGDLNCDDAVDPVDALAVLRHDAGLYFPLEFPCILPDRLVWREV